MHLKTIDFLIDFFNILKKLQLPLTIQRKINKQLSTKSLSFKKIYRSFYIYHSSSDSVPGIVC